MDGGGDDEKRGQRRPGHVGSQETRSGGACRALEASHTPTSHSLPPIRRRPPNGHRGVVRPRRQVHADSPLSQRDERHLSRHVGRGYAVAVRPPALSHSLTRPQLSSPLPPLLPPLLPPPNHLIYPPRPASLHTTDSVLSLSVRSSPPLPTRAAPLPSPPRRQRASGAFASCSPPLSLTPEWCAALRLHHCLASARACLSCSPASCMLCCVSVRRGAFCRCLLRLLLWATSVGSSHEEGPQFSAPLPLSSPPLRWVLAALYGAVSGLIARLCLRRCVWRCA